MQNGNREYYDTYNNESYNNNMTQRNKKNKPLQDKYKICLVDTNTKRYIGFINGQVKLLDKFTDEESKPFFLKANIFFLPRSGEYVKIPNLNKYLEVSHIVHDLIIDKFIPTIIYLFVNYTSKKSNKEQQSIVEGI